MRVNVGQLLSASVALSREAGAIIRAVRASGDLQTHDKGVDDPCTVADVRAQRLIISGLRSVWPALSIVGEEDTPDLDKAAHTPALDLVDGAVVPAELRDVDVADVSVFIDPLDATKEFTLGVLPCVMTLIGICVRGDPVAGVMNQAFEGATGHTVYGMRGALGVVGLPGSRARLAAHAADQLVAVTTSSHGSAALDAAIARVRPHVVLREGGCGYKSLLVMAGVADVYLYPSPGTKRWDTCAPEALLRAMGGVLSDAQGQPIVYRTAGDMGNASLVACRDAALHARVIAALRADTDRSHI